MTNINREILQIAGHLGGLLLLNLSVFGALFGVSTPHDDAGSKCLSLFIFRQVKFFTLVSKHTTFVCYTTYKEVHCDIFE